MNNESVKLSDEGRLFLQKGCSNHQLFHETISKLTPAEFLDLITKYFKDNNKVYLELIKMEVKKNGFK